MKTLNNNQTEPKGKAEYMPNVMIVEVSRPTASGISECLNQLKLIRFSFEKQGFLECLCKSKARATQILSLCLLLIKQLNCKQSSRESIVTKCKIYHLKLHEVVTCFGKK